MKIAVTYENGNVFQHFGRSAQFKVYTVEEGKIVSSQVIDTNGSGHGALVDLLAANQIEALICGGIGRGAQQALALSGIRLYAGQVGSADVCVQALEEGTLEQLEAATCDHHDHGYDCGEHTCGEHGCGNH